MYYDVCVHTSRVLHISRQAQYVKMIKVLFTCNSKQQEDIIITPRLFSQYSTCY